MSAKERATIGINLVLERVGGINVDDIDARLMRAIITSGTACIELKKRKNNTVLLRNARAVLRTRLRLAIATCQID